MRFERTSLSRFLRSIGGSHECANKLFRNQRRAQTEIESGPFRAPAACVSLREVRWCVIDDCMFKFFRRFFLSDFGEPPPPDVADQPIFSGQRIVDTIYSDSQRERAFITLDDTGDYRIIVQRWDTSDWSAGHGARWSGDGSGSHTDTIERAREIARESLRCAREN